MEAEELLKTLHSQQAAQKDVSKNPQVIFSWKAPLRAYKRKSNGVLRFYIALALLLSLIVFFFGDKILVLPIWATMFLVYVLTITPPPITENYITRFGIETAGNTYRWESLSHFYFIKKFDYHVAVLVGKPPASSYSYLVIQDDKTKDKLFHVLAEHILFVEKPQKTFTDKMSEWLTKLMPDDDEATHSQTEEAQVGFSKTAA